jgi:hypothetical protein
MANLNTNRAVPKSDVDNLVWLLLVIGASDFWFLCITLLNEDLTWGHTMAQSDEMHHFWQWLPFLAMASVTKIKFLWLTHKRHTLFHNYIFLSKCWRLDDVNDVILLAKFPKQSNTSLALHMLSDAFMSKPVSCSSWYNVGNAPQTLNRYNIFVVAVWCEHNGCLAVADALLISILSFYYLYFQSNQELSCFTKELAFSRAMCCLHVETRSATADLAWAKTTDYRYLPTVQLLPHW